MPTLFKFDLKNGTVKTVECKIPKWPGTDADGDTIFENSHFKSEAKAWAALEEEAVAWVRNTARELDEIRKREADTTRELADRALILVHIQEARLVHNTTPDSQPTARTC